MAENVANQILEGNRSIFGLMLESHIHAGNQPIPANRDELKYGVSITDACIDWDHTVSALDLPAGSFMIQTKVSVFAGFAPGQDVITCTLVTPTGSDAATERYGTGTGGRYATVPNQYVLTTASPVTVRVDCASVSVGFSVLSYRVAALKVADVQFPA